MVDKIMFCNHGYDLCSTATGNVFCLGIGAPLILLTAPGLSSSFGYRYSALHSSFIWRIGSIIMAFAIIEACCSWMEWWPSGTT